MKNILTDKLDDLAEHLSNDQPANTVLGFAQKIGRPWIYFAIGCMALAVAFAIFWIAYKKFEFPPGYVIGGMVTMVVAGLGVREIGKANQLKARAETIDPEV